MTATCAACTRPVGDNARLCQRCTDLLARDLGEIGGLADELQTTRLRLSRMGGASTGVITRTQDRPLAWDERAAEAAFVLRSTVVAWVRVVLEEAGGRREGPVCAGLCLHVSCRYVRRSTPPTDTLASMGAYLLGYVDWLRHHQAADECADEIAYATQNARHVIDRAASQSYAGPCRETVEAHDDRGEACCLAELHVRDGARVVRCPVCAAEHDVADRKAWLLAVAENNLVTATELHRLLAFVGHTVPASTIRSWVHRNRLLPHGSSEPPLYRVGDAIDLVVARKVSA